MFEIEHQQYQIFQKFRQRKNACKIVIDLPKDKTYSAFLEYCIDTEITPDLIFFGYETAIKENQYLAQHFPKFFAYFWMIGRTGQGDEWFLDRQTCEVLFYDHNQGEYQDRNQFKSMKISFFQFLQFALLLKELETRIDENACTALEFTCFNHAVNMIHPELFEHYPFNYL